MSQKVVAPLADNLIIGGEYIVRFRAVDPTTGADVSGVKVTKVNVTSDDRGGGAGLSPVKAVLIPGPNT